MNRKRFQDDEESGGEMDNDYESEEDQDNEEDDDEQEHDQEEKSVNVKLRNELKKELKAMSLGEIEKLRRNGFNGVPLHKAAGFKDVKSFLSWLSSEDGENDDDNENEAESDDDDNAEKKNEKEFDHNKASLSSSKRSSEQSLKELEKKVRLENAARKKKKDAPRVELSTKRVKRDLVRKSFAEGLLVPSKRELLNPKFEKARDPRFDGVSTEHIEASKTLVERNYAFLFEQREKEIDELDKIIKEARSITNQLKSNSVSDEKKKRLKRKLVKEDELKKIQAELTRLQQQRAKYLQEKESREALSGFMKRERELVSTGAKSPFFLKKRDQQRLILEKRFEKLDAEGNLDKVLEKRRKKNTQKDRRMLPKMKF